MPGGMRRVKGGYKVIWGGKTRAKRTTKAKAQRQLNLLLGLKHGFKPTGRKARK
jgi:hypothetical protein